VVEVTVFWGTGKRRLGIESQKRKLSKATLMVSREGKSY
jgi:hypothetical protein